ncbi:hypothetical protein H6F42_02190 [Pseudanabaena sp. FACHB-1998]|uniref:hypothetical protein n=1 Tax=Pseudanabaena sp. FACHB-1998 TaxID=2692858 RepID=UPI0016817BCB|nr:hypothetical protein [Pseudanabaena sp. FACHB-1998]MBD2175729.1 hypothetical protein [Pseudanabaena sp. FACHB-1998]
MFDLLTNILIWIIAIPVFIILFRAIPKDWFRLFGLVIFTALVVIIFASFKFVEEPIPKTVIDFLSFPFTLTGIILLLLFFNHWLRLRDIKIKSGDKVDNKGAIEKIAIVTKELLIVLIIFAIATNNATSDLFNCYLEQQSVNASEQSFRRPIVNLTEQDQRDFEGEAFDLIVVLADNAPYIPRLQEALKRWTNSQRIPKPYILLSGGRKTTYPPTKGYPCQIQSESLPNRTKAIIKEEITSLGYDPRYTNYFTKNPAATDAGLPEIDLTEADQMCDILSNLLSFPNSPNIIAALRDSIIIEPSGLSIRSSGDEINKLIKDIIKNKIPQVTDQIKESNRNNQKVLLITSPIEGTRAFLSFRNQDFNVSLITTDYRSFRSRVIPLERYIPEKQNQLYKKCPAPIAKEIKIRPEYFLFSANSFAQSERAWTEIKELVFYTLRFWLRPPITDERPYYPKVPEATTPVQ